MTISAPNPQDTRAQLRKTMGFWDVLLFNIATVLGPRWIAAAGHNGTSSISLWMLAAVFFFVPGAFVINELSSRFPEEGGLYVVGQGGVRAVPRIRGRMDLLDLHRLLFSGAAAGLGVDVGVCAGRERRGAGGESRVPDLVFAGAAGGCGGAEYYRAEHRQVAAERRRAWAPTFRC